MDSSVSAGLADNDAGSYMDMAKTMARDNGWFDVDQVRAGRQGAAVNVFCFSTITRTMSRPTSRPWDLRYGSRR